MRASPTTLAWLLIGCGGMAATPTSPSASNTSGTEQQQATVSSDPAEAAWSQRAQAQAVSRAIELWSAQAENDETKWIRVAQAQHFYATVHATSAAETLAHAQAGVTAATTALDDLAPDVLRQVQASGQSLDAIAPALVPALYWYARLQALLAQARGYAELLLIDESVGRALVACERAQADYDHFGSVVMLAKRDAHPLDVSRRNLTSARQRFDRALAAEPNYLAHRVELAEHYAVIAADRPLFERELTIARDLALPPTAPAEQAIAQTKANMLLEHVNELFE